MSGYRMPNTRTIHVSGVEKNVRGNSSRHSVIGIVTRTWGIPPFYLAVATEFVPFPNVNTRSEALPECDR